MPEKSPSSSIVLAVFFASGATSLIYQVLWTRWFGLVFGNTTISVTLVLAAFMCGLALGSTVVERSIRRWQRPLRVYAICEAAIGAFALCFPLLLRGVEHLYLAIGAGGALEQIVKLVLAFALLCLPTGAMGATLPLLAEHFRRHPQDRSTWRVGVLYAANTIGAATGILLAGFVLIELFGIRATTWIAAVGNLVVAVIAWTVDARRVVVVDAVEGPSSSEGVSPTTSIDSGWVGAVLAVTGALALALEVLWTRLFSSFLGTSTYAFTTIVCTYLVGIAIGSAIMSRLVRSIVEVRGTLLAMVLIAGVLHAISIEAFLVMAKHADVARTIYVPVLDILKLYLRFSLLLLPIAMASGACFPLATRILNPGAGEAAGALVARAYAANTWGSVVGSLVAGFGIAAFFDFEPALRLVAGGYVVAALVGVVALRAVPRVAVPVGVVATLLGAGVAARALTQPSFVERVEAATGYKVLRHEPSIQGVTSVLSIDGEPSIAVNHHGMTAKVTATKLMAHIPLLLHDKPVDTLVICFGMGTTFRSAMRHGGNVTVVELVPAVADSFEYFYDDAARVRAEPRGRIVVDDGRHHLMATEQRFDVITLDPPPPIDGEGVNNLYSTDFAALARDRLKPGGIVAHWMPELMTLSGVDDEATLAMIKQSFASAFPYTYEMPSRAGIHMLGSMTPIVVDEATIRARIEARPGVKADLDEFGVVDPAFLWSFTPYQTNPTALLTSDDHPLLEFYLLRNLEEAKVPAAHFWR